MNEQDKSRLILYISLIIIGWFFIKSVTVSTFVITGDSMEPTLKNGQKIIKTAYYKPDQPLNRGDIVILKDPTDANKILVKRVIAKEGDRVQMKKGVLMINDIPIVEPYLKEKDYETWVTGPNRLLKKSEHPIPIPKDHLLVLGDNRAYSKDSRVFGYVHKKDIIRSIMID